MSVPIITSRNLEINNNKRNAPSFRRLVSMRYNRNFMPNIIENDLKAVEAFTTSKTFRYLFENYNVRAFFEKIIDEKQSIERTILHYSVEPVGYKKYPLSKRIFLNVKSHFFNENSLKEWIEGWENKATGEKHPLYEEIQKITLDDIKENSTVFFKKFGIKDI